MLRTSLLVAALAVGADAFSGPRLLSTRPINLRQPILSSVHRPTRISPTMTSDVAISTSKSGTQKNKPTLNKITFSYDFFKVPFEKGIEHIHSPEHISGTHKFGAPFFKLLKVLPPKLNESKASITYFCSTLLMRNMYIRMYTNRPNQSNLIFFNPSGKALYQVSLIVVPLQGFTSHKLIIEINLFSRWIPKMMIALMMPIFLFINGLEDRLAFGRDPATEESNFSEYRRMVTHNLDKNILDLNAEVYQKYRST